MRTHHFYQIRPGLEKNRSRNIALTKAIAVLANRTRPIFSLTRPPYITAIHKAVTSTPT